MPHQWTLSRALKFIRQFRHLANEAGYNISLGGGVLNNGHSHKDLDLVATPRQVNKHSRPDLDRLKSIDLPGLMPHGERTRWDNGLCLSYDYHGRRIDILVFNVRPW